MGISPDHRHAGQPRALDALRSLQDLDDALTVAAADAAVDDATTAGAGNGGNAEDADPPLSRAERRGRRRAGAGRRPGPAVNPRNAALPVKRPVGRGRDPRLPRR